MATKKRKPFPKYVYAVALFRAVSSTPSRVLRTAHTKATDARALARKFVGDRKGKYGSFELLKLSVHS